MARQTGRRAAAPRPPDYRLPGAALVAVLAAIASYAVAKRPSAALRSLRAQTAVGRGAFERGAWADCVRELGDPLRARAASLVSLDERRLAWPALHGASCHRAQCALRAADEVADAAARGDALARAVDLFAAAVEIDAAALSFWDFLYDYARALRRAGRDADAAALFADARAHAPEDAFPWGANPAQMPCCGALAPAAMFRDERGWRSSDAHDVPRRLAEAAPAILKEAENLTLAGFASLEGHGVEVRGGPTGVVLGPSEAPWRELLLYSNPTGWDEAACARLPSACAALRGAVDVSGAPAAVDVGPDGGGACCRVEVLALDAGAVILPHAAPTNARLKSHLGLAGCGGASLTVAGETRRVESGSVLTFDDSFWHGAANDGPATRLVLSVDFWKPELAAR